MQDEVVRDLSHWRVIGVSCEMPDQQCGATVKIRFRSSPDEMEHVLTFRNVPCKSVVAHFPLFNASVQIRDTSGRGWERTQRFEVTDSDDAGPYFYAADFEED